MHRCCSDHVAAMETMAYGCWRVILNHCLNCLCQDVPRANINDNVYYYGSIHA